MKKLKPQFAQNLLPGDSKKPSITRSSTLNFLFCYSFLHCYHPTFQTSQFKPNFLEVRETDTEHRSGQYTYRLSAPSPSPGMLLLSINCRQGEHAGQPTGAQPSPTAQGVTSSTLPSRRRLPLTQQRRLSQRQEAARRQSTLQRWSCTWRSTVTRCKLTAQEHI